MDGQLSFSASQIDAILGKANAYPAAASGTEGQVPVIQSGGVVGWADQSGGSDANLAPVEESSTASQAYAVNSFLIYNGQLYRVTADIAQGGTITPNTNCVAADAGTYLAMVAENPSAIGFQANMGFVEDSTYAGCYYRNVTVNNQTVQEWLIPPLAAGTEYRTTERFLGKPVYVKVIDSGTTTASGSGQAIKPHGISNMKYPINCETIVTQGSASICTPFGSSIETAVISSVDTSQVILTKVPSWWDGATFKSIIKYTKSTD